MKQKLGALIENALDALKTQGIIDQNIVPKITIDRARDSQYGDFASNLAMVLAKQAGLNPRQLAEKIIAALPEDPAITKVEIAGPGFINFFINPNAQFQIIKQIHDLGKKFGESKVGAGKKVQVEFVSANPTGPLHVGHGHQRGSLRQQGVRCCRHLQANDETV